MSDERLRDFVGFKATNSDAANYRAAAKARKTDLSKMVRAALDQLVSGSARGIAKNEAEATLLDFVRLEPGLAADLSALGGAAAADRDAREVLRRLAALLSRGKGGPPSTQGRKV